ncbi:uncharacterized protein MKK02DRAFT_23429 [Dioszegia hungarica]|uniref:SMP-30/Gluconolactonase/LRE-like region domain-containing protein n=1 Tax=Dioszegia hungarica TaxID=4972 RepID=A0AA38HCP3_9TREE|nr:uncharacterized protein MKK02DRAFT_23429 [Dioszegia hungarica]KAI9637761.1 hypothetical protein MKK02DRAFT_23429 [Dioszegia hungarica]
MSGFFPIPPTIAARRIASVPQALYATTESEWVLPSAGKPPTIFLEGITSDKQGNLFMVDIPYGRILRYDIAKGDFSVVSQWDGEPNGLALRDDGHLVVADYKEGILSVDPSSGKVSPLLTRRNLERFKGPNDIIVASNGDIYFTDQGQTGMTDPTGLVYRLSPSGKLDVLLSNGPSPNGLVLSPDEKFLYVAMTRDNSVWRCPLQKDGSTSKVMKFFTAFGSSGPDGLTVDAAGNLFICHASLECIFVVDKTGRPLARIVAPEDRDPSHPAHFNNCIFGSTESDRNILYFVDSAVGDVYAVDWEQEGGTILRASA